MDMAKSLAIVLGSLGCVFSFTLSHTHLCLHNILAEKKKKELHGMLIP